MNILYFVNLIIFLFWSKYVDNELCWSDDYYGQIVGNKLIIYKYLKYIVYKVTCCPTFEFIIKEFIGQI